MMKKEIFNGMSKVAVRKSLKEKAIVMIILKKIFKMKKK